MAKTYWVATYNSITDTEKMAAYAKIAGPAIEAYGGKFIVRGMPSQTYENGLQQRVVIIEFESLNAAKTAHDSPEYTKALEVLGNGADRDIRIVEGV